MAGEVMMTPEDAAMTADRRRRPLGEGQCYDNEQVSRQTKQAEKISVAYTLTCSPLSYFRSGQAGWGELGYPVNTVQSELDVYARLYRQLTFMLSSARFPDETSSPIHFTRNQA
jgi:hypothetical protein